MSAISTIAGDGHRRECDQAGRAGPRARSHDRPRSDQHGHGEEADEDQVLDRRLRGRDLGDEEAERYRDQGSTHQPEPLASRLPGRRVSSREVNDVEQADRGPAQDERPGECPQIDDEEKLVRKWRNRDSRRARARVAAPTR